MEKDEDMTMKNFETFSESYSVTFETKRVDAKNVNIKIYEPVKIIKIIKEQS
ncbi:hypothetical protein P3K77_17415 [Bacillus cytotoxicus]